MSDFKLGPFKAEPIQNPKSKIQNRVTIAYQFLMLLDSPYNLFFAHLNKTIDNTISNYLHRLLAD